MPTTNSMTGPVSINATDSTQILLTNLGSPKTITLAVAATNTAARTTYVVNGETLNVAGSANSFVFANTTASLIQEPGSGTIGTLTLCAANTSDTGQTYVLAKPLY